MVESDLEGPRSRDNDQCTHKKPNLHSHSHPPRGTSLSTTPTHPLKVQKLSPTKIENFKDRDAAIIVMKNLIEIIIVKNKNCSKLV